MKATVQTDVCDPLLSDEVGCFHTIFGQAAVGVAQVETATGRFLRVNQRYSDILGYSTEELLQTDFQTLTYAEDRPASRENMRRLQQDEVRDFTIEKRYRRKDGCIVWASVTVSALWAPGERPTVHIAVLEDITERKRLVAEAQRRASEMAALNDLGRAVNSTLALDGIITAAFSGIYHAVRPELSLLFLREGNGLTLREVLPPPARELLDAVPEHRLGQCLCGLAALEGRPCYSRDIFQDGRCSGEECKKVGLKSFAALPLRNGHEVVGVIGLASKTERDFGEQARFLETMTEQVSSSLANARLFETAQRELTERRRVEEEVKRLSQWLLRTQRISKVGGWAINLKSGEVWVSPEARRIYGAGQDGLISIPDLKSFPLPRYRPLLDRAMREVVEEGKPYDVEFQIRRRVDGVIVEIHSVAEYNRDEVTVLGVIEDVTQRKQAEGEKEKLRQQLAQAQKMESVGRLAGGVAHDFNNMLQAILGNVGMALEDLPMDSPARECLEEIQKSAQRSADLTRQLLAFARKQTIQPRLLDLNDTLRGMLKMLRRLIGENIDLDWMPGADLWPVKMDPSQIDQVLANLCVNARDAIPAYGHVAIETANVTLDGANCLNHPECPPGDYVMLAVSDTGRGMDEETRAHLFEPFFTTKEIGKGTGLGLATVFGIVKQNGGLINVDSELGQGATFKIYLPRADAEAVTPPLETVSRSLRGTETVLLVEDEEQILNLGRRILTQHGYTVLTAIRPEAALDLAAQHASGIHLLITDVVMPGMNGKELRERVQAIQPGIKCLFMSGHTANVIAQNGVLDDGVRFLQKPFDHRALAETVRKVLDPDLKP